MSAASDGGGGGGDGGGGGRSAVFFPMPLLEARVNPWARGPHRTATRACERMRTGRSHALANECDGLE